MMPKLFYDVALLPSASLAQQAVAVSRGLASHEALFTLGTSTYLPHLSLYMVQIDTDGIKKAETVLHDIAAKTRTFSLSAQSYNQSRGYIDVAYDKPQALADLQTTVVEDLAPLRTGTHEQYLRMLHVLKPVAQTNVEHYGYPNIGELLRPHLTLTRFAGGKEISLEDVPVSDIFSGDYDRLGLFELGPHGTCIRQVAINELLS